MFQKTIKLSGLDTVLACDGNCSKAFGLNGRLRRGGQYLADGELTSAPVDPGWYEGGDAKPVNAKGPDDMNKWCARECERSVLATPGQPLRLPDWSKRRR